MNPDDWKSQANCKGMDPLIFTPIDEDHPWGDGLELDERNDLTRSMFKTASEACSLCPVRAECYKDADRYDRYWTYRAGKVPGYFNFLKRNPDDPYDGHDRKCRDRGHEPPATGRCVTCKNINRRKKYAETGEQTL